MGKFADKWAEAFRVFRALVEPHLQLNEQLDGVVQATDQKTFSSKFYVIGITPVRLILIPVDRKWNALGPPRSITKPEITTCSVWGWGDTVTAWLTSNTDQQIKIGTADVKLKLLVLGGNIVENALAGEDHLRGVDALIEFLLSSQR